MYPEKKPPLSICLSVSLSVCMFNSLLVSLTIAHTHIHFLSISLSFPYFILLIYYFQVALGKNFIVKNTSTNMIHTNNTTAIVIKLVPQDLE